MNISASSPISLSQAAQIYGQITKDVGALQSFYDFSEPDQFAILGLIDATTRKREAQTLRDAADAAFKDKSIQGLARAAIGNWLRFHADKKEQP